MSVWSPPTFAVGQRVRVIIRAECPFANSELGNGSRYTLQEKAHACHADSIHGAIGTVIYTKDNMLEDHPYEVIFAHLQVVRAGPEDRQWAEEIGKGHYAWTELEPLEEVSP
jgi:hypothetical protein